MINVPNTARSHVLSFVRRNERDKVFAVFNFSPASRTVTFDSDLCHGRYTDHFSHERTVVDGSTRMTLDPWAYRVLVR
jgi:hypothetical protein